VKEREVKMSVKIPRRLLESVIRQSLREQDEVPAGTEAPQQALSNEEKFKKQLAMLNAAKEEAVVTGQDRKFVKRGGDWYLADVQLSEESLLGLVKDEFIEDLQKKIKRGATSITVRGDQFIGGGTQKSATFVKKGTGVWEDQSPVPPQIVAQYIALPDESPEFEADVSGVGGEKQWVYKQEELMVVITEQRLLVMATSGNQDDPLGATANMLEKTGILSNFKDVGKPRTGPLGLGGPKGDFEKFANSRETLLKFLKVGDQPGEFYNVPLANLNMGDLTKAIGKARTLGAKVFDLFTADNIKMNFTMTKFGPALERSLVLGGRKGEGGSGGISDKDVRALIETGLFREEALPNAGGGRYSVNLDPKSQKRIVPNDDETSDPKGSLEVTQLGDVKFTPPISYVPEIEKYTSSEIGTFADAFLLYSEGLVAKQAVEQLSQTVAPQPPAAAPGTAASEPPAAETPLGVAGGAVFFKFNSVDYEDDVKAERYIRTVVDSLKREDIEAIKKKFPDVVYTIVATASTEGSDQYNVELSKKRAEKVVARIRAIVGSDSDISELSYATRPVGEAPYKDVHNKLTKEQSTYQRFVKLYWGPIDNANAEVLAKDFANTIASGQNPNIPEYLNTLPPKPANESRQMQEIRRHIRKILLEAIR